MKKSKGFTLVELLAVIVILAVLVLVATPAVTSIMQRSQQNSFKNEMLNMVKEFNTAFTEKSGKKIETKTTLTTEDAAKTAVYNVKTTGTSAGSYKYLCMTLKDLVDEQYVKKDLGESYGGYIQMWVPNTGEPIVFINTTNSAFYLQGKESQINSSEHIPSQDAVKNAPSGFESEPNKDTGCPTDFNIPADTVINNYKGE
ncbi:MAG: type II secretion system protein [Firmicutes bacterium]|nr:type II secretion system protein [Bacillota bacterium]